MHKLEKDQTVKKNTGSPRFHYRNADLPDKQDYRHNIQFYGCKYSKTS